jgi:hypothetical protein
MQDTRLSDNQYLLNQALAEYNPYERKIKGGIT